MDLYSARIHQLSGAQGALLPLLIRLINHSWKHLSSLGSIQLNCCHYSAYWDGANQPTLPSQVPIWPLGEEKQLWFSVLLKDTSVTAGIRTHILLLTPELESGKLDRSATTQKWMPLAELFFPRPNVGNFWKDFLKKNWLLTTSCKKWEFHRNSTWGKIRFPASNQQDGMIPVPLKSAKRPLLIAIFLNFIWPRRH